MKTNIENFYETFPVIYKQRFLEYALDPDKIYECLTGYFTADCQWKSECKSLVEFFDLFDAKGEFTAEGKEFFKSIIDRDSYFGTSDTRDPKDNFLSARDRFILMAVGGILLTELGGAFVTDFSVATDDQVKRLQRKQAEFIDTSPYRDENNIQSELQHWNRKILEGTVSQTINDLYIIDNQDIFQYDYGLLVYNDTFFANWMLGKEIMQIISNSKMTEEIIDQVARLILAREDNPVGFLESIDKAWHEQVCNKIESLNRAAKESLTDYLDDPKKTNEEKVNELAWFILGQKDHVIEKNLKEVNKELYGEVHNKIAALATQLEDLKQMQEQNRDQNSKTHFSKQDLSKNKDYVQKILTTHAEQSPKFSAVNSFSAFIEYITKLIIQSINLLTPIFTKQPLSVIDPILERKQKMDYFANKFNDYKEKMLEVQQGASKQQTRDEPENKNSFEP